MIKPNKCAEVAASLIAEHNIVLRNPADDDPGPMAVCVAAVDAMEPQEVLEIIWTCEEGIDWLQGCIAVSGPDDDVHTALRYTAMVALDETIQKQLAAK